MHDTRTTFGLELILVRLNPDSGTHGPDLFPDQVDPKKLLKIRLTGVIFGFAPGGFFWLKFVTLLVVFKRVFLYFVQFFEIQ